MVEDLYRVVGSVRGIDVTLLRGYVASLRARSRSLSANERFALQRLEGLSRVALAG
jgi:hypothetical protein